ncbi:MAG TPA: hypothetical protein VLC51_08385 [Nitrospira sp.]|nr:hypothetical protein [Nitrospira sp.]
MGTPTGTTKQASCKFEEKSTRAAETKTGLEGRTEIAERLAGAIEAVVGLEHR